MTGSSFSKPNERHSKGLSLLVFLLSPFFSFLLAVKNFQNSWAKNIIWAFVAFYGYTFVIGNEGMDSSRYRDRFLAFTQEDLSFSGFVGFLYSGDNQALDIVQPLISFIVSLFTSNYHFLFAAFGLFLGYFYSRNVWYLLEKTNLNIQKKNILVIVTFAVIVGFWEINGFRFWSAAHVFFYGAMRFIWEGKKKFLWWAAFSIFVHFAFLLPVAVLVLYHFLGNRINIYFWLLIISFFIVEINVASVGELLQSVLPDVFHSKVQDFTNQEYIENLSNRNIERSFHSFFYAKGLNWTVIGLLIIIFINSRKTLEKKIRPAFKLLNFCFLFLAIANVASLLPAGGRFVRMGMMFSVALIYFHIHFFPKDKQINWSSLLWIPILIFYIIVSVRIGFETIGVLTIVGNPVLVLFMDSEIPLIDLIK